MVDTKIEIVQSGGRFTMQKVEDGQTVVLLSDKDGARTGNQWWLHPAINITAHLRGCGCSDVQIGQVIDSLLSGKDTNLSLDVPRATTARWI
jgi:hypothetical protein